MITITGTGQRGGARPASARNIANVGVQTRKKTGKTEFRRAHIIIVEPGDSKENAVSDCNRLAPGKNNAVIFDFVDVLNPVFKASAMSRFNTYNSQGITDKVSTRCQTGSQPCPE